MYTDQQRKIVSVRYDCGKYSGDWNYDLGNDNPFTRVEITDEALDRAVFELNELNNHLPLMRIQEARNLRADSIYEVFQTAARNLINKMEKDENWDVWMDRIK